MSPFNSFLSRRKKIAKQAALEATLKHQSVQGLSALFRRYHISRAFLFGSILSGSCRKNSDIDLYVEGLDAEQYWDLWKELEHHSGETIDLYYENDDPHLVQRILNTGEIDL